MSAPMLAAQLSPCGCLVLRCAFVAVRLEEVLAFEAPPFFAPPLFFDAARGEPLVCADEVSRSALAFRPRVFDVVRLGVLAMTVPWAGVEPELWLSEATARVL